MPFGISPSLWKDSVFKDMLWVAVCSFVIVILMIVFPSRHGWDLMSYGLLGFAAILIVAPWFYARHPKLTCIGYCLICLGAGVHAVVKQEAGATWYFVWSLLMGLFYAQRLLEPSRASLRPATPRMRRR